MSRVKCPYPERFRLLCRRERYTGHGYVTEWVECEAKKDNGWYACYVIHDNGRERAWYGSQLGRPMRWKELQEAFARGTDVRQITEEPDDVDLPDFSELL